MKTITTRAVSAVMVPVMLVACAALPPPGTKLTEQERAEAQKNCINQYVVGGAIGGALLGMLVSSRNDRAQGAVVGAIAGGALAYSIAWGKCLKYYSDTNSFPVADARQTAASVGYTASRGNEVRIQNFTVTPSQIAPGGNLKLSGSYYVMAPDGQQEVKVVETRTVHFFDPSANEWKELGSETTPITAALGTRRSEGQTGMPTEVAEGRYRVTFKVSALGREDQASQEVVIKKT
ncbi:glycine zipper 2TM domain-containing protein [Rhodoferax sp.]|uniref:glycine zipper 2TM domain-containing protein n=1 Tax=Rhodoferax sp. TaxID=50421 RepID=UPI002630A60D|nr:glycine zipper 2TM domain-containing protein [Rhodoferax sp.]MDD2926092.1 glycine zipper 2TM domain-containing protein [Rhodoferax sp.]